MGKTTAAVGLKKTHRGWKKVDGEDEKANWGGKWKANGKWQMANGKCRGGRPKSLIIMDDGWQRYLRVD